MPLDQIICGMGVGGRIGADGDMRLVMQKGIDHITEYVKGDGIQFSYWQRRVLERQKEKKLFETLWWINITENCVKESF